MALLSINADGTLQRWNQRAADAFGGDLARQPAPHINALLGTAVSQQLLADLGKSGHYHSELTLTRAGQNRVWVIIWLISVTSIQKKLFFNYQS